MHRLVGVFATAFALCAPAAASASTPSWSAGILGYDPTSSSACASGQERCVDDVIRRMQDRFDPIARSCHHNAVFALAYLRTTQMYKRTLYAPSPARRGDYGTNYSWRFPLFADRPWLNHYDYVFGEYYFHQYDAWRAGRTRDYAPAWRVAFESAEKRHLPASGNLSLGINAHINNDLPQVLYRIGAVSGRSRSSEPRLPDHLAVNQFLDDVTKPLIAEIARRFDRTAADGDLENTEIDDEALFSLITTWRDQAFDKAERIHAAYRAGGATGRDAEIREIEEEALATALSLKKTSQYPLLSTAADVRDAYCRAQQAR